MDPNFSHQDVVRCKLCEAAAPPLYCEICKMKLCKVCVGEHLLDESKYHIVIPFKDRKTNRQISVPECREHTAKLCELHCEKCDTPLCVQCVSSKNHKTHDVVDIISFLEGKNKALQADLEELGKTIYSKYKEIASSLKDQRADLRRNTEKLISAIDMRGEDWHNEINNIVRKLKDEIKQTESENLTALKKQEDEIKHGIIEITESIGDLKKLLASNDDCLLLKYKSRNAEFKKLPPNLVVSLQFFYPKIDTVQLFKQFGSLTKERFDTRMTFNEFVYPVWGSMSHPIEFYCPKKLFHDYDDDDLYS